MKTTTNDILKTILFVIIVLGLIGFFTNETINSRMSKQIKQEQTKIKQDKIKQDINTSIQQMVKLTNAVTNWTSTLSTASAADELVIRKIFTFELEKLWLIDSPILFIGEIDDIKIKNDKEYTLIINLDLLNSGDIIFDTTIRLLLSAPRNIIDSFIKDNPGVTNDMFSSVAVVAKIKSVDSSNKLETVENEETLEIEVKNGYGNMLNIKFLGEYYKMFSN